MPSDTVLQTVGNWSNRLEIGLHAALVASVELTGKSGHQAVMQAIIYMAKTAAAHTKTAKKNRKVLKKTDAKGRHYKYVEVWNANDANTGATTFWELSETLTRPKNQASKYSWDKVKLISNRGLAKRSWLWGLKKMNSRLARGSFSQSMKKPIVGVANTVEYFRRDKCGMILYNRLNYIDKAAPTNIGEIAAMAASNRIMAQAAKALESKFGATVPRLAEGRAKTLAAKQKKTLAQAYKEAM